MTDLGLKVGQIDQNGTNPGLFRSDFKTNFPGFVPFEVNLTHFVPKSDIPDYGN